jgi:hypothetical protein
VAVVAELVESVREMLESAVLLRLNTVGEVSGLSPPFPPAELSHGTLAFLPCALISLLKSNTVFSSR